MKPLRILLADDHALFRAGLRARLRELPDAQVIAEVGNGNDAVELTRQHHPDVVVMDISMKGLNGLEATARIKAEAPATKVIVLSMHDSEDYVAQALRASACGYLLKDSANPNWNSHCARWCAAKLISVPGYRNRWSTPMSAAPVRTACRRARLPRASARSCNSLPKATAPR